MQSTFESFDDQILESFSVQEQHANVHLRGGLGDVEMLTA